MKQIFISRNLHERNFEEEKYLYILIQRYNETLNRLLYMFKLCGFYLVGLLIPHF